jgi:cell division protein FtsL
MRIIHFFVICALVISAAYVYRIKMDSTSRMEKVVKLRADIREERNQIASLKAEWSTLTAPGRLQGLAERHLPLKPVDASQFDSLKNLPPRPPSFIKPNDPDPIGAMLDTIDPQSTGSIPSPAAPATASTGGAP